MTVLLTVAAIWLAVVLLGYAVVLPLLRSGPDREAVSGLLWYSDRVFVRLVHRARFEGQEELRDRVDAGPLVVVSNHTGSIDPFLIQAGCRFAVRWMMAMELMYPSLAPLWKQQRLIAVNRDGTDRASAREAIRHVRQGGVVGIFPEGRIVTPPRRIWPFYAGAGLVIARTKAPVLLVWISGTPETNGVLGSLTQRSRSHVRFLEIIRYDESLGAAEITEDLRRRLAEASGWPMVDDPAASHQPSAISQLGRESGAADAAARLPGR